MSQEQTQDTRQQAHEPRQGQGQGRDAEAGGTPARITGWSHVSLSVRDRDASVAWYGDLFGFKPVAVMDDPDGYVRTIMMHATGAVLAIQQHDANPGDAFAPHRTGLDHLSFGVASRDDLDTWAVRLAEAGVEQSPIVETVFGHVLCFRDPDGVQLELFHSPLV